MLAKFEISRSNTGSKKKENQEEVTLLGSLYRLLVDAQPLWDGASQS